MTDSRTVTQLIKFHSSKSAVSQFVRIFHYQTFCAIATILILFLSILLNDKYIHNACGGFMIENRGYQLSFFVVIPLLHSCLLSSSFYIHHCSSFPFLNSAHECFSTVLIKIATYFSLRICQCIRLMRHAGG